MTTETPSKTAAIQQATDESNMHRFDDGWAPRLGQYVDRPEAHMPCCPSCGSARVTDPDDEGLQDCRACGIWFDPCLRQELDQWLEEVGAVTLRVERLEPAVFAHHAGRLPVTETYRRGGKSHVRRCLVPTLSHDHEAFAVGLEGYHRASEQRAAYLDRIASGEGP